MKTNEFSLKHTVPEQTERSLHIKVNDPQGSNKTVVGAQSGQPLGVKVDGPEFCIRKSLSKMTRN